MKHSCLPLSCSKAVCSFGFDICTPYTDMRKCTWRVCGSFPMKRRLIPSCLPPAHLLHTPAHTNTANNQVILELLSLVLNPARAALRPLAPESAARACLQSPTCCSLESHFQILRLKRSVRIICKASGYPFSIPQGSL